jgi:hypothetical protein
MKAGEQLHKRPCSAEWFREVGGYDCWKEFLVKGFTGKKFPYIGGELSEVEIMPNYSNR